MDWLLIVGVVLMIAGLLLTFDESDNLDNLLKRKDLDEK